MILLTKLDKSKVLVSLDNIKFVESTPDTLVRFVNGDMLIVSGLSMKLPALFKTSKRAVL
jgi:uncharacterized protein YlzI (FlbEa/FlbD family)